MNKRNLQLQQMDSRMLTISELKKMPAPANGWVRAIRTAIGMSMEQLGRKLHMSKQSVQALEKREQEGTITLKLLREAAHGMDMELVYGFIAKDGSLENLIDRKADELSRQIIGRASQTMKMEDQANSEKRIKKSIEERAKDIKEKMPKILWD